MKTRGIVVAATLAALMGLAAPAQAGIDGGGIPVPLPGDSCTTADDQPGIINEAGECVATSSTAG